MLIIKNAINVIKMRIIIALIMIEQNVIKLMILSIFIQLSQIIFILVEENAIKFLNVWNALQKISVLNVKMASLFIKGIALKI